LKVDLKKGNDWLAKCFLNKEVEKINGEKDLLNEYKEYINTQLPHEKTN